MAKDVWTIGHSTRDLASFLELLRASSIELLVDIRRFPGSRRFPHFHSADLADSLSREGIGYRHLESLGGRRTLHLPDSPNTAWRVPAFNAFADYMGTPAFELGLSELIAEAEKRRATIMCSEAVPWRCHRRLISDALIVRGWTVWDIFSLGKVERHALTDFARVSGQRITYPSDPLFPLDS